MKSQERSPLQNNFDATLKLVRDLRKDVSENPTYEEEGKGGELVLKTNPSYVLLSQQEIHLRGLAIQIGPLNVEADLLSEFRESLELVEAMMPKVIGAPTVAGERHARVRNPYGVILSYAQTHLRGCNALLMKAKTNLSQGEDKSYEELFAEPRSHGVA